MFSLPPQLELDLNATTTSSLYAPSSSTSPFDLHRLPSDVSSQLMYTLSQSCDLPTLLSLMRLSKASYQYFGPALYRNITLTIRASKFIFQGLDFDLERRSEHAAREKERMERERLRKQSEKGGFWSGIFRKKIKENGQGELTAFPLRRTEPPTTSSEAAEGESKKIPEKDSIHNLKLVDALSIYKRKFDLLSNLEWITITSFESLYHFSEIIKSAYQTTIYQSHDEESKKRLFDNLIGISFNSNINPQNHSTRQSFVSSPYSFGFANNYHETDTSSSLLSNYLNPLTDHLRPKKICLYIQNEHDLDYGNLGRQFSSIGICRKWFLDLVTFHISLPNPLDAANGGNMNYNTCNIIKKLINEFPLAKKLRFIFGSNCCTKDPDPTSYCISPKTTAEKYKYKSLDRVKTSWELVDLNCWNTLGMIICKVDEYDWIDKSTYSIPILDDTLPDETADAQVNGNKKSDKTKMEKTKPVVEIINLPCLERITLDSIRLAASQRAVESSRLQDLNPNHSSSHQSRHIQVNWLELRNEWLEHNFKILNKEDVVDSCECALSVGNIEIFSKSLNWY